MFPSHGMDGFRTKIAVGSYFIHNSHNIKRNLTIFLPKREKDVVERCIMDKRCLNFVVNCFNREKSYFLAPCYKHRSTHELFIHSNFYFSGNTEITCIKMTYDKYVTTYKSSVIFCLFYRLFSICPSYGTFHSQLEAARTTFILAF